MEMGADDYITKPFEDIELLNAIEIRLKKAAVLEKKYPASENGISEFLKDVKGAGLIKELAEKYNIEKIGKKLSVYLEGRRPKFLFYLLKGKVKGFKNHEYGKEYITDIYSEGDFLGYSSLIENSNYTENTIVLEDAEILQIPREDFLQMIYGDMNVAARFIRIITQNVKEKEERLLNLAYSSLRKRVAKSLVDIHQKFNPGETNHPLEISRDDIAHYVGTATESLIRTLSDFKAEKLIEIKDSKITVDHRNGNTLDNRKINLRACTQSQNTKNRSKTLKPTTSKFKGIYLNVNKKWVAQIRVNYKRICLWSFENEITAAEAYNNAAIKYFGEFALLNKL